MKPTIFASGAAFLILLLGCNSNKGEQPLENPYTIESEMAKDPVKRGEYLVSSNGCHDCHTPKKFTDKGMELDLTRALSGHPAGEVLAPYDLKTAQSYILFTMGLTSATGPWGTSFSANLTPDATGLGGWTEDQFLVAIKQGLYKGIEGSRPLLPPMPWQQIRNFTDEDLKAIFAYLQSLPPVKNVVPDPIPPAG